MLRCLFGAFAVCSLQAGVVVKKVDVHIHVEVDGKPLTDFYYGPDAPKPYCHPLRSASRKFVTRMRYRMVIHPAMDGSQIEKRYRQYAAEP